MHLSLSRMMGKSKSQPSRAVLLVRQIEDARSLAMVCRLQLPLRTQLVQRESCWDSSSCTLVRRASRALGLLVWTTMPSST